MKVLICIALLAVALPSVIQSKPYQSKYYVVSIDDEKIVLLSQMMMLEDDIPHGNKKIQVIRGSLSYVYNQSQPGGWSLRRVSIGVDCSENLIKIGPPSEYTSSGDHLGVYGDFDTQGEVVTPEAGTIISGAQRIVCEPYKTQIEEPAIPIDDVPKAMIREYRAMVAKMNNSASGQ